MKTSIKKKICVFIGSRANYSSLKPIMKKIQKDQSLTLILFVGASALLEKYGKAVDIIKQDGFNVNEYIYMTISGGNPVAMAKSTGLGLVEISNLLNKYEPDLTFIVGDRYEMLSIAIASAFMNIPIAHSMGGEISGTIDESIRHSITKLSHIHFAANELAKQNIIKMGENPKMIFNFGCPRIDSVKKIINENNSANINKLIKKDGVGDVFKIEKNFLLVSQHPVTTEFDDGEKQINETLYALKNIQKKSDIPIIMLWPNVDAGTDKISQGIRKFREKNKLSNFHFFKNLPLEIYIHLLNKTKCLIGNSSSGIREGAYLGTPVVNIGTRQNYRLQGKNVINVGYNKEKIKDAILKQIKNGKYKSESIYGKGNASSKIIKILKNINIKIQKKLHY